MIKVPMYPLRFEPIYQYRVWGGRRLAELLTAPLPGDGPIGEAWLLSDRDDHSSKVADGPLEGSTIRQLMEQSPDPLLGKLAGRFRRFPVLLKFLDAHAKLSVQVHPEDGQKDYIPAGESGKSEAWVVLEAGPASRIYAGLKPGTTQDELERALAGRTVPDLLASFTPRVGDAVFVRAGTVHSLSDVVVFEVQENSDVTFRLYDWDRVDPKTGKPRPLQVEQAIACIDLSKSRSVRWRRWRRKLRRYGESDSFNMSISRYGGTADNRRSQSARRARRGCWLASSARGNWSTAAPVIPSATATSCSCRRRLVHVRAGHSHQSLCWRSHCRDCCGGGHNEKARCFRPGRNAGPEQGIA